ncbi:MAG: hypothetical protein ACYTDY_20335, partial [Planctomycetota bacterium]
GIPWREQRLYARVALPKGLEGRLGRPEVNTGAAKTARTKVRHEVWGGRRYVNVLLEAEGRKLGVPGYVAELAFPIER